MPYLPIIRKGSSFSDLGIGEKFFFYSDFDRNVGPATIGVKVSGDSFIVGGGNGVFAGLSILCSSDPRLSSSVERLGTMAEAEYETLTAAYR